MNVDNSFELRHTKFRLRQAHKTIGKQGDTIHRLRADVAEVRELNSKLDRGELRRAERQVTDLEAEVEQLRKENKKLRDDQEGPEGPDA